MKLGSLLGAGIAALLLLGMACETAATDATTDDRLCTPGAYVFCRCADRTKGTKLCEPDGKTFADCTTGTDGECVGGEVPDPDTNKTVDGNGDIVPGQGDDDDTVTASDMDQCPGKPIAVPPGEAIQLQGDTSRAVNDRRGKPGGACAASTGAKDFVYQLTPEGSGSLSVSVAGQGALDPIVYLRTTCDDENTQAACGAQSPTKTATTRLQVRTGIPYFLFVDGASGGSGAYTATVQLTTGSFCGDGEVDTNEACDDTNHTDGDGCNASCRGVDGNPTSGGTCPGQPVDMWPNQTVTGVGSTASGYGNTLGTPGFDCTLGDPNDTPDHVYQVTPHGNGNLTVVLTPKATGADPAPNLMVSAHATCTATAPATFCKNDKTDGSAETMVVPAQSGTPVFIAVEGGASGVKGDFTISFNLK